jgi:hypothetical protein
MKRKTLKKEIKTVKKQTSINGKMEVKRNLEKLGNQVNDSSSRSAERRKVYRKIYIL